MNHAIGSEVSEVLGPLEKEEMGRSPSPKRAKVLPDNSMPIPAGAKQQQTIESYGPNGQNRDKYVRKDLVNPRDGPVLNEDPIEVQNSSFHRLKFKF